MGRGIGEACKPREETTYSPVLQSYVTCDTTFFVATIGSRTGTELAGYRVESVLGRGGMGVVYLAEDVRLHRKVALKVISPELADHPRFRDRFLRESQQAASIDHPNIIPVYDAGGS